MVHREAHEATRALEMGREINLLRSYPKAKRNLAARAAVKTEADRIIARQFGKDFFDGDRRTGYGGFGYDPRFWSPVVPDIIQHFGLLAGDSVLDVGCAKGFMLFDLLAGLPELRVGGLDVSEYAIANALGPVAQFLQVGSADSLPFADNSFDVVISINTIHNLDLDGCKKALTEIERVARRGSFVTVDAFRNPEEEERMMQWNLTAKTILSVEDWIRLFDEVGYTGDYYWFIP